MTHIKYEQNGTVQLNVLQGKQKLITFTVADSVTNTVKQSENWIIIVSGKIYQMFKTL